MPAADPGALAEPAELADREVPVVLGGQEPEALGELEAPEALGDRELAVLVEQEEPPGEARALEEARVDRMA